MRIHPLVVPAVLVLPQFAAGADTLVKYDGTELTGTVLRLKDGHLDVQPSGDAKPDAGGTRGHLVRKARSGTPCSPKASFHAADRLMTGTTPRQKSQRRSSFAKDCTHSGSCSFRALRERPSTSRGRVPESRSRKSPATFCSNGRPTPTRSLTRPDWMRKAFGVRMSWMSRSHRWGTSCMNGRPPNPSAKSATSAIFKFKEVRHGPPGQSGFSAHADQFRSDVLWPDQSTEGTANTRSSSTATMAANSTSERPRRLHNRRFAHPKRMSGPFD